MAIRLVIIGRRDPALTHEECIEYLETEHVPLVKQLPGLQKLTTSIPLAPEEAGYDELAQLWFESPADLKEAMQTTAWERILTDAENFVDVEETVMVTVGEQTLQYHSVPGDL